MTWVCRKSPPSSRTSYFHSISSAGTFFRVPTTHTPPDLAQIGRRTSSSPRYRPIFPLTRRGHSRPSQLPHKFDRVVFCPLTEIQTAVYERLLQTPNVQNILRRNEECDCGSKKPYAHHPNYSVRQTYGTFCTQPAQLPLQDGSGRHFSIYDRVYQDIEPPGPDLTWHVPHNLSHWSRGF